MGNLYIVATPIGNLNDFSNRAVETLRNSDIILVEDTRQTIKLLNHFNIKTKMISYHKFNETKRTLEIIDKLKEGLNISLVSDAGTPCISDPGYIIVREARKNNINVYGVPGCCAVVTALSVGGLDTSSFTFYGFVPTENKQKKELFDSIKNSNIKTKIIYESPKRLLKTILYIKNEMPGCMVSVCTELTKVHEDCISGKIEDVYNILNENNDNIKGEYVILISNDVLKEEKEEFSIEAKLLDAIVKNKFSIKDAVTYVFENSKDISKKEIYNASLKLKNILK